MAIVTFPITILNRQSLSDVVNYGTNLVVGIIMPDTWTTGAHVSVLISVDGVAFFDLFNFSDRAGTSPKQFAFNVVPGAIIAINPNRMLMGQYVQLRSGERNAPVPTAATRVFTLITNTVDAIP